MGEEEREFDVLLVGATGWTGMHLAEYFALNYPLDDGEVKWAMAGRNPKKLKGVVQRVRNLVQADWVDSIPLVKMDNTDEEEVQAATKRTKVVATVAGPFAKFGELLVKACVENGTHYVDITGEPNFIKRMLRKYDEQAKANKVMMVPSCGFDSVPTDLATFLAVDKADKELSKKVSQVDAYMVASGQSNLTDAGNGEKPMGGTLMSLLGAVEQDRKALMEAYSLVDKAEMKELSNRRDRNHKPRMGISRDSRMKKRPWTTGFAMAYINEKNVRRSSYLLPELYGKNFRYNERMATGSFLVALVVGIVMSVGIELLRFAPVRSLFKRFIPATSQTPPERTDKFKSGFFKFTVLAKTEGSKASPAQTVVCTVKGKGDPGYEGTSLLLGESALTLLFDLEKVRQATDIEGGFVTPAVLGHALRDRLEAKGTTFSLKVQD